MIIDCRPLRKWHRSYRHCKKELMELWFQCTYSLFPVADTYIEPTEKRKLSLNGSVLQVPLLSIRERKVLPSIEDSNMPEKFPTHFWK